MSEATSTKNWLLGILGAIAGGVLGYFAFSFLVGQGLYAMVLPGALVGLGCGYLSGMESKMLGCVCGVGALLLSIYIEWDFFAFTKDRSFAFFVSHLHQLKPMTMLMIAVGGMMAFWLGRGREKL